MMRRVNLTKSPVIFIVLSIVVAGIIAETSIIKIYRLTSPTLLVVWDIAAFGIMAVIYGVAQFILLKIIRIKITSDRHIALSWLNKIVTPIQYVLISLLVLAIGQMIVVSNYNVSIIVAAISASYGLAIFMTALLALRFYSWFRSSRNAVILMYSLASVSLLVNATLTLAYVSNGLLSVSLVVSPYIGHFTAFSSQSAILYSGYIISSIVSFIITWIATILLMRHHSKTLGALRYWVLVVIPLIFFLVQFQPLFFEILSGYRIFEPVLFNILYTLIFSLSAPVGGVLFGIAFWILAKSVRGSTLKDYLIIAGAGLMLYFTSNQATGLLARAYPPFGMVTISYVGLSSYLILVGIYFSAISVAQDVKLRQSIRNSVKQNLEILDQIGIAEIQAGIEKRIVALTKSLSAEITKETGIEPSLEEQDIKDYMAEVIEETKSLRRNEQEKKE